MHEDQPIGQNKAEMVRRDAESFTLLGGFLDVLALIVLLATVFQEPGPPRVVNFCADMVLFLIGLAMLLRGVALRRRLR